MRQKFFIAVDADQVLQSAGDTGLLMRLQLRQINHQVGFDDFPGDQVPMPARTVIFAQQLRVVHRHPELIAIRRYRFQNTLACQIE